MPKRPPCGVCSAEDAFYRCPRCLLRYCGAQCFKAHSAACSDEKHEDSKDSEGATLSASSPADAAATAASLGSGAATASAATRCDSVKAKRTNGDDDDEGEEDENTLRLTQSQLQSLWGAENVRKALRDPRLQRVIDSIDTAPNRSAALQQARERDSDLSAFVDNVLETVGMLERRHSDGGVYFAPPRAPRPQLPPPR